MRPRIVRTAALPVDLATQIGDVDVVGPPTGRASLADLRDALASADALVTLLTERVDAAVLDSAPRLRVVANYAVGFDNIDVAAASARGIAVSNTPDVLTEATADLAFALLLAAARRLGEGERLVRSGGWTGWEPGQLLGVDVWGRTLGIVGLGRIGLAVARRARGFGMDVLYARAGERAEGGAESPRRRALQGAAADLGAREVSLDALFGEADVVSLHCPLTPATRHLVDARRLEQMKPTAILVNTARGGCVDEAALADALARGRLAGAGLDVFADEPTIHPALLAQERVVLAPHIGSATTRARTRMGELCAGAVRAVLAGRQPANLVNPEVWPHRRFLDRPALAGGEVLPQ